MTAYEKRYAIVLEKLGKKPAQNMIKRVKDKQLRHRIFQTSFRGIQRAIEEKAREYGHSDSSNDPMVTAPNRYTPSSPKTTGVALT